MRWRPRLHWPHVCILRYAHTYHYLWPDCKLTRGHGSRPLVTDTQLPLSYIHLLSLVIKVMATNAMIHATQACKSDPMRN